MSFYLVYPKYLLCSQLLWLLSCLFLCRHLKFPLKDYSSPWLCCMIKTLTCMWFVQLSSPTVHGGGGVSGLKYCHTIGYKSLCSCDLIVRQCSLSSVVSMFSWCTKWLSTLISDAAALQAWESSYPGTTVWNFIASMVLLILPHTNTAKTKISTNSHAATEKHTQTYSKYTHLQTPAVQLCVMRPSYTLFRHAQCPACACFP